MALPCIGCSHEHFSICLLYLKEANKFHASGNQELAIKHLQDAFTECAASERHLMSLGMIELAAKVRGVKKEIQKSMMEKTPVRQEVIDKASKLQGKILSVLVKEPGLCITCLVHGPEHELEGV